MPLLKLQTTETIGDPAALATALTQAVAEATGKSAQYVMVVVSPADITLGGASGPAAFADVRGIGGLSPEVNAAITEQVCAVLADQLAIPPARIYLTFTELAATHWGWNGSTFG